MMSWTNFRPAIMSESWFRRCDLPMFVKKLSSQNWFVVQMLAARSIKSPFNRVDVALTALKVAKGLRHWNLCFGGQFYEMITNLLNFMIILAYFNGFIAYFTRFWCFIWLFHLKFHSKSCRQKVHSLESGQRITSFHIHCSSWCRLMSTFHHKICTWLIGANGQCSCKMWFRISKSILQMKKCS